MIDESSDEVRLIRSGNQKGLMRAALEVTMLEYLCFRGFLHSLLLGNDHTVYYCTLLHQQLLNILNSISLHTFAPGVVVVFAALS